MALRYGEDVLRITKRYSVMRKALDWYLIREAANSQTRLQPMMKPLFYEFGLRYSNIYDEYLLGMSLLVAPILEEDQTKRTVTLPEGDWYDFFSQVTLQGPCLLEREYPIDEIGIFIKCDDTEFDRLRASFASLEFV